MILKGASQAYQLCGLIFFSTAYRRKKKKVRALEILKMIGAKKLISLFDLNLSYVCDHEEKNRWVNVLRSLALEDEKDIEDEFGKILDRVGPDKPKLYYVEGVRRNLMISKNERLKGGLMPKAIKDLFK